MTLLTGGAFAQDAQNEPFIPTFQQRFANQDRNLCQEKDQDFLFLRLRNNDVLKTPRDMVYSVSSQSNLERNFPEDDWTLDEDHGCRNNPLPSVGVVLKIAAVPGIGEFHQKDQPELSIGHLPKSQIDKFLSKTSNALEWAEGLGYTLDFDPARNTRAIGCNSVGAPVWPHVYERILSNGLYVCADAPGVESIARAAAVYKASRDVYPDYFESGYPFVFKCTGAWRTSACTSAGVLEVGDTLFYRYRIVQNVAFHYQDNDKDRAHPLAEEDILKFDKWVRAFVRAAIVHP